eukprot:12993369-Alexandrium_andersonii.AAC.1
MARRAASMRLPPDGLAMVAKGKITPAATYGAATASVAKGQLKRLQSAVVEAVDVRAAPNKSLD